MVQLEMDKEDRVSFHQKCFQCAKCGNVLEGSYTIHNKMPIHVKCS